MTELQRAIAARRTAEERVRAAEDHLIALQRREPSFLEMHQAISDVAFAMIEMNDAMLTVGAVAGVAANTVPDPIIEHEEAPERPHTDIEDWHETPIGFTACWKTVEGKPGNCRMPENHEGDCAPF